MSRYFGNITLSCLVWIAVGSIWSNESFAQASRASKDRQASAARKEPRPDVSEETPSLAEQVGRLQRTITAEEKQLAELKAEQQTPDEQYRNAESEFNAIDTQLEAKTRAKAALEQKKDAKGSAVIETELVGIRKRWKLAKDRFDLEIEERKTLLRQIATLEQELRRDRRALDGLNGKPEAESKPDREETPSAAPKPGEPSPKPGEPSPTNLLAPGSPGPVSTSTATSTAATATKTATKANTDSETAPTTDKELSAAQRDAQAKEKAAKEALRAESSIEKRLESLKSNIALQKAALQTSRKIADNALETRKMLAEELQTKSTSGASKAEIDEIAAKMREADARYREHRAEVAQRTDELDRLQSELSGLLAQEVGAKKTAEEKEKDARAATLKMEELQNPFAPRNVLKWLFEHGPKMFAIVLAMVVFHWLSKRFSRQIVLLMARAGRRGGGTSEEREARANTLVGVFHNAVSILIIGGGSLMVLQEAGIPIAPLLGGAAVFGLAVAFGAQNLIRDYFYGFVILLENQYKLNDVVKIGALSGQVEQITLRMTVLRDLEGNVHFVPNGQVTSVTNMTHGWSRALFDVGVAYKEDVDRVMAVINELGEELRNEAPYSSVILEPLTMLGVDALADSAVILKFYIKTRPLQQWTVKREMLRRVKNKFDELGIEIPFPHRTVFHRLDDAMPNMKALLNQPRLFDDAGRAKNK